MKRLVRKITAGIVILLMLFSFALPVNAANSNSCTAQTLNGAGLSAIMELIKKSLGDSSSLKKYLEAYAMQYCNPALNDKLPSPSAPPSTVEPSPTPDAESAANAYELEVVELVNEQRKQAGLKALTVDDNLMSAARGRAVEIKSRFSHTRPDGSSCFTILKEYGVSYRGAGENIASGHSSAKAVMNGWMNSSGHRANILNSSFTKIGVGCYKDASGRLHWAQMFIY